MLGKVELNGRTAKDAWMIPKHLEESNVRKSEY